MMPTTETGRPTQRGPGGRRAWYLGLLLALTIGGTVAVRGMRTEPTDPGLSACRASAVMAPVVSVVESASSFDGSLTTGSADSDDARAQVTSGELPAATLPLIELADPAATDPLEMACRSESPELETPVETPVQFPSAVPAGAEHQGPQGPSQPDQAEG
jgi:hypothetical protein